MDSRTARPSAASSAGLAYPLLTMTALLWAGNAVAGKWAVGEVLPQVLTCFRWAIVFAILAVVARRAVMVDRPKLERRWLYVLLMGAGGYTIFASLLYLASIYTRTMNVALFQGAIPVFVILMNFAVRGARVTPGQILGTALRLLGVAIAATHGDWRVVATLSHNVGDLLMLGACLLYAGYTVALPARPDVSGLAFFTAMAAAAFVTSLPPLAAEWALGRTIWPTLTGWLIVLYVALGPTLVSQLWFIRGVELIGPNRAGLFVNLVPIFGALLAVLLVGEPFGWNEALALALVIGGIAIAERFRARPAT